MSQSNMYSPDLFESENRINVFCVDSGAWAGYIVKEADGGFRAVRMNGQELIAANEEAAKIFIRNPKMKPYLFAIFEAPESNPDQLSLFQ